MHHVFSVEEEDKYAWGAEDDQVDPSKEHVLGEEFAKVVDGKEEGHGREDDFNENRDNVGKISSPASLCAVQIPPYFQLFWGAGGGRVQGCSDFLLVFWSENFKSKVKSLTRVTCFEGPGMVILEVKMSGWQLLAFPSPQLP